MLSTNTKETVAFLLFEQCKNDLRASFYPSDQMLAWKENDERCYYSVFKDLISDVYATL